jgi:hypothetical protein
MEIILRLGEFAGAFHNVVKATEDKSLARKARERYEKYKYDILTSSPDFRPFVNCHEYRKPGMPNDEDISVHSSAAPMDLGYVRKIVKKCVVFYSRKQRTEVHSVPLDGNSLGMSRLMQQTNCF